MKEQEDGLYAQQAKHELKVPSINDTLNADDWLEKKYLEFEKNNPSLSSRISFKEGAKIMLYKIKQLNSKSPPPSEARSKEEILNACTEVGTYWDSIEKNSILQAMEEYAQQFKK